MIRSLTMAAIQALTIASAQAGTTVSVNIKDLSLPADTAALAGRIHAAAEKACGAAVYTADNRPSAISEAESDHRACVRRASAQAMAQVVATQPQTAQAGAARTMLANQ